jgi:hypothetical protein
MIEGMGVHLLADVAQTAMITTFVAAFGCIVAAAIAMPMRDVPGQPAEEAFGLARVMAVLGGAAGLVTGVVGTVYFFLIGVASPRAFLLVEMGLIGGAAAFWLAVSVMLQARASRTG